MWKWLKANSQPVPEEIEYVGNHRTRDGELSTMEKTAAQMEARRISGANVSEPVATEILDAWKKSNVNSTKRAAIVVPTQKPVPVVPVYATAEDLAEVAEEADKNISVEPAEVPEYQAAHRREDYAPSKPVGTASVSSVDITSTS